MTTKSRQDRKARQARLAQLKAAQSKVELQAQALEDQIAEIDDVGGMPIPSVKEESEKETKDYWGGELPMMYAEPEPAYEGATTLADALAAMDAGAQAEAMQDAIELFQAVMKNILDSDAITDKGAAIGAAAKELQKLLNDPTPLLNKEVTEDKAQLTPTPKTTPVPDSPAIAEKGLFDRFWIWLQEKAGARHNSADQTNVQAIHDASAALGAECGMKMLKGADGQYYAFGYVSNNFRDRDYAKHAKGEIITEAAHKEFVSHLDTHPGEAPELWCWHTPGTARKSRATWWDYSDGFLCMLWPLTEKEAKGFEGDDQIAMSHGFYVLKRNAKEGLIEQYRAFEGSDLPPEVAANPYTDLELMRKESTMFDEKKKAYLVKRLGEDAVKELEAHPAEMAKALADMGAESKETSTGSVAPVTTPAPATPTTLDELKTLFNLDGLQKVITDQAAQLKAQGEQLAEMKTQLEGVKKSDDAKVAEVLTPRVTPMNWGGFQASTAKSTEVTKDKIENKVGGGTWLKQLVDNAGAEA